MSAVYKYRIETQSSRLEMTDSCTSTFLTSMWRMLTFDPSRLVFELRDDVPFFCRESLFFQNSLDGLPVALRVVYDTVPYLGHPNIRGRATRTTVRYGRYTKKDNNNNNKRKKKQQQKKLRVVKQKKTKKKATRQPVLSLEPTHLCEAQLRSMLRARDTSTGPPVFSQSGFVNLRRPFWM